MKVIDCLIKLKNELNLPYIDVSCHKSHEEICRYVLGDGATGKEKLYMYSCGKVVTIVSALRLVEDGRLDLDGRVCDYLPEIKNAFILDGKGEKVAVGETMTVRHLFTMTAGFTYNLYTNPVVDLVKQSDGKAVLREFISKFVETPLAFAPGERFEYSLCHDVLAAVVEVVSGKKFSTYVKEAIFNPLEMNSSGFDNDETNMADVYIASEDGKLNKIKEENVLLPTKLYESGGAGLISTVDDYAIFADALANGGVAKNGYRVLKAETIELMTTEQVKKLSVNSGFTCIQGDDVYGYGLGVRVRQTATDWGLGKGEFGWDGAACSYVMIDAEKEVSVFIGMHIRNWPFVFKGKHLEIVKAIYEEFINK